MKYTLLASQKAIGRSDGSEDVRPDSRYGKDVTSAAPMSTPGIEPTPPMITMATNEMANGSESGPSEAGGMKNPALCFETISYWIATAPVMKCSARVDSAR